MRKLWGSAIAYTESVNISMLGQSATQYQESVSLALYGNTAGKNGISKNVAISLDGSPTPPIYSESLNVTLLTSNRGSLSEVMPITMSGKNFSANPKVINMTIHATPDDVGDGCLISEGPDQFEILVENTSQCFAVGNAVKSNVNMSIFSDETGFWQESMNLTMRYHPSNIVNMSMKVQGTQVISSIPLGTEDGGSALGTEDGLGFLATIYPVVITIMGGSVTTKTVNLSMPTAHSQIPKTVNICTRGF